MKRSLVLAVGLGLSGCAVPPPQGPQIERGVPFTLTADHFPTIEAGVRSSLKDPASAMFGPQMGAARMADGDIIVCGTVNAKNSYGGYTGAKPFAGVLSETPAHFAVAGMGGTDTETYAVTEFCNRSGVGI